MDDKKELFEEQGKVRGNPLCGGLFLYGLVQMVLTIIQLVFALIVLNSDSPFAFASYIYGGSNLILHTVFIVYIVNSYQKESKRRDAYYKGFFLGFGLLAGLAPFLLGLSRLVFQAILKQDALSFAPMMAMYKNFSLCIATLLLCICMVICGSVKAKKSLVLVAVLLFFLFFIIVGGVEFISSNPGRLSIEAGYQFIVAAGFMFAAHTLKNN